MFVLDSLLEELHDAITHLLVSQFHAEAELAEVLEEGVGPSRTATHIVLRVRCGGNGARVDRRATRGVGHHLAVAIELGDELDVGRLTATRAGAGELEERRGELRILHVGLRVYEVLLCLHLVRAVGPVRHLIHLRLEVLHHERLLALLTRADVGTVAAAETVEHVHLNAEVHAGKHLALSLELREVGALLFLFVKHEGTDRGVRADVGTLVTLDTVVHVPLGNERGHTALLEICCALHPCTVLNALEGRYRQQVAILSVDGSHHLVDEGRIIVFRARIVGQFGPSGIHGELLVLASTIYSGVVLIHHVLALATVRLDDELLHLLHSQVNRDDARDAEEGRLEDGVRTVAKADLLCDLCGIHVVHRDVVLGKVLLHLVRQVARQIVTLPDGVEQEGAVLAETAGHVVHVQIGLHVARYEVRRVHQVSRADRVIAEAEVRTGEATRLLGVVREVGLAILIGVVADDLH